MPAYRISIWPSILADLMTRDGVEEGLAWLITPHGDPVWVFAWTHVWWCVVEGFGSITAQTPAITLGCKAKLQTLNHPTHLGHMAGGLWMRTSSQIIGGVFLPISTLWNPETRVDRLMGVEFGMGSRRGSHPNLYIAKLAILLTLWQHFPKCRASPTHLGHFWNLAFICNLGYIQNLGMFLKFGVLLKFGVHLLFGCHWKVGFLLTFGGRS